MSIAIGIGIGLLAGILAGMLGVGGGVILIPGMVLLMGVEQHTAQGVSLAVITLIALVGTITHYRQENVRLGVALWIIPAAVLFSFLGGMVADMIGTSLLRQIFGGVIIIVGLFMATRGWRGRQELES
jgi:hypothetical protein